MIRYILRRLLGAVALLFGVSLITFAIFYLLPSAEPARLRAGKQPTPALIAEIRRTLWLNRPWYEQYLHLLDRAVLHLDLGYSYQSNVPVKTALLERLPATVSLALGAAVVWLVAGIAVGTIAGVKRGSLFDRLAMGGALVAISAPVYWLALVSLYLFADVIGRIHLFPGAGRYVGLTQSPTAWFDSLVLPWLVLAASFVAIYARLLRASMSDVMSADYIRTARAKGLAERTVVVRHGLRVAITPIVTAAGVDIGLLLGGVILTETAFNIPGIGRLVYESVVSGDLPMIEGTVLLGALFIVLANLLVDVTYALLDPRIRYA